MRVLMMTTAVPTHFTPLVPLAWGLRAAGHEVIVAGQPEVMPAVRSAGLNGVSLGEPLGLDEALRSMLKAGQRFLAAQPRPRAEDMGFFGRVWMANARKLFPDYLALARELDPALIVADQVEYTSLLVGGVLDVPVVHHRWGVDAISALALREATEELADLAADLGLAGLPAPAVTLDPCPPSLQLPATPPGTPIRFVPFNGTAVLPDWVRRLRQNGRPGGTGHRVAVSFGHSLYPMNGVPFVRHVLSTCAEVPDIEIIATVEEDYREALGSLPPQVRLVDPTPLHLFLDQCDVIVDQGGAGTSLTAITAGIPQLALPQWADQFGTGDRLRDLGAGLVLDRVETQDDPATVRAALESLLSDPGYRRASGKLRGEMAGMPTPAQVAGELLTLASHSVENAPARA
jgi:UDP:flavonoid glycosyltransferase YjiC (YdhE family)